MIFYLINLDIKLCAVKNNLISLKKIYKYQLSPCSSVGRAIDL